MNQNVSYHMLGAEVCLYQQYSKDNHTERLTDVVVYVNGPDNMQQTQDISSLTVVMIQIGLNPVNACQTELNLQKLITVKVWQVSESRIHERSSTSQE